MLYLLNNLLGGGMSSRLFQTVREESALAYAIYSELSPFRDVGALSIYAGTSIEKTKEMLRLILQELRLLKEQPVSEDELKRARDQSKGNIILGLESSSSRMSNLRGSRCITAVSPPRRRSPPPSSGYAGRHSTRGPGTLSP